MYRTVGGEPLIGEDDEVAMDVVEVDMLRKLSIRLLPLLLL